MVRSQVKHGSRSHGEAPKCSDFPSSLCALERGRAYGSGRAGGELKSKWVTPAVSVLTSVLDMWHFKPVTIIGAVNSQVLWLRPEFWMRTAPFFHARTRADDELSRGPVVSICCLTPPVMPQLLARGWNNQWAMGACIFCSALLYSLTFRRRNNSAKLQGKNKQTKLRNTRPFNYSLRLRTLSLFDFDRSKLVIFDQYYV